MLVFCEGRKRISDLHVLLTSTLPPEARILTLYAGMESDEREDEEHHTDGVLLTAGEANSSPSQQAVLRDTRLAWDITGHAVSTTAAR